MLNTSNVSNPDRSLVLVKKLSNKHFGERELHEYNNTTIKNQKALAKSAFWFLSEMLSKYYSRLSSSIILSSSSSSSSIALTPLRSRTTWLY